ncbi:MAG: hypothetical protein CUN55_11815 [Phototrophicales bacterium]|nr:MAG: hypothetical protein CUN55_11815 [Phototrophicales bacterium]
MMRDNRIRSNQIRVVGLVVVALAASIGFVWLLARLTDTTTTVILANEGNCPRALLQLQPRDGGSVLTLVAGPGERDEVQVVPDVEYDYIMTTESPDIDDTEGTVRVCFDRDSGIIEVPEGGSFTYRVTSVTRPYIVFEVDEACPAATLRLSARGDDEREPVIVESGESKEVEIAPDRAYTYSIELVQLADPAANICDGVESAQISLSMGESETIRVQPRAAE